MYAEASALCSPNISGRKQAEVTEKSLLELVLPLWGQDSPFAFASPSPPSISKPLGGQRRQSPRPLSLARVVLNLFWVETYRKLWTLSEWGQSLGDKAQFESFAKL